MLVLLYVTYITDLNTFYLMPSLGFKLYIMGCLIHFKPIVLYYIDMSADLTKGSFGHFSSFYVIKISKKSKFSRFCKFLHYSQIASNMLYNQRRKQF